MLCGLLGRTVTLYDVLAGTEFNSAGLSIAACPTIPGFSGKPYCYHPYRWRQWECNRRQGMQYLPNGMWLTQVSFYVSPTRGDIDQSTYRVFNEVCSPGVQWKITSATDDQYQQYEKDPFGNPTSGPPTYPYPNFYNYAKKDFNQYPLYESDTSFFGGRRSVLKMYQNAAFGRVAVPGTSTELFFQDERCIYGWSQKLIINVGTLGVPNWQGWEV